MIIELPGFDFEAPTLNVITAEPLLDKVRQFLDMRGISRNEYAFGDQVAAGMGELILRKLNNFWLVYTTERGVNFDVSIFSNQFYAINYFIFRLTGEKETIDWSSF